VGAVLLCLPFSTNSGRISPVDALFTATSAVCVTGLIVRDTGTFFSSTGQAIIIVLIQLGGLGIMTFSTMILLVAGRRISFTDRIAVQDGFSHVATKDIRSLIGDVFFYTVAIELAGGLSLFFGFLRHYPWKRAVALSFFHSISAFCNAGFSLFSNSLASYRDDAWVNATVLLLIILGGLGFLVHRDLVRVLFRVLRRKRIRLNLHSKLVLTVSLCLILFPFGLFLGMEWNRSLEAFSLKGKVLASLFQVVTPRTAGFQTMDVATLGTAAALLLMLLMFIGASPGSTGGGVKTSTVGILFAFLRSKIAAKDAVSLFHRTVPSATVLKALTVVSLALTLVFVMSFALVLDQPELNLKDAAFEVISAFSTVGLSMGITSDLSPLGKIVLIVTMYIGRIGPLVLLSAFSRSQSKGKFEYVEESVMIG
jgi:trk system potassium uptake protein TrkH